MTGHAIPVEEQPARPGDPPDHPADGCHQRHSRLAWCGEVSAGQQGFPDLLGRQCEKEAHQDVVDDLLDRVRRVRAARVIRLPVTGFDMLCDAKQ